jgi:hypothetical protein
VRRQGVSVWHREVELRRRGRRLVNKITQKIWRGRMAAHELVFEEAFWEVYIQVRVGLIYQDGIYPAAKWSDTRVRWSK